MKLGMGRLALLSASLGPIVIFLFSGITGNPISHQLAQVIGLSNTYYLSSILGLSLSLWLVIGGRKRIIRFASSLFGLFCGWMVWRFGEDYVWLIEAILVGGFGASAASFTFLIALTILF